MYLRVWLFCKEQKIVQVPCSNVGPPLDLMLEVELFKLLVWHRKEAFGFDLLKQIQTNKGRVIFANLLPQQPSSSLLMLFVGGFSRSSILGKWWTAAGE